MTGFSVHRLFDTANLTPDIFIIFLFFFTILFFPQLFRQLRAVAKCAGVAISPGQRVSSRSRKPDVAPIHRSNPCRIPVRRLPKKEVTEAEARGTNDELRGARGENEAEFADCDAFRSGAALRDLFVSCSLFFLSSPSTVSDGFVRAPSLSSLLACSPTSITRSRVYRYERTSERTIVKKDD